MSKVAKRYTFAGLQIAVENPAGSERSWPGDGGVERKTTMRHDYGFIEDTKGVDGDEVDCYIGPNPNARFAYVVHQLARPGYDRHDEDKCLIGFDSEELAKAAYLAHRDDGDLAYGGMSAIPIGDFVRKMETRKGSGKIRHDRPAGEFFDSWLTQMHAVALDGLAALEISIGRSMALDVGLVNGRVRSSVWDRGMTFGEKVKDGQRTEFSVETFGQFMDNWLKRGEKISLCYNHQSAYVQQNGQPAPALAQYDAIALVQGGRVVRFAKLLASGAIEPQVMELEQRTAQLATEIDPRPTADGLWFFRACVTELGHQLLPNFSYISPMFTATGKDEQGNDQGYTLIDLAATNTAFQAGCVISFDKKVAMMARSLEDLKARYRELNSALARAANESDANALRRERDQTQEEIRKHPDAKPSDMGASSSAVTMAAKGAFGNARPRDDWERELNSRLSAKGLYVNGARDAQRVAKMYADGLNPQEAYDELTDQGTGKYSSSARRIFKYEARPAPKRRRLNLTLGRAVQAFGSYPAAGQVTSPEMAEALVRSAGVQPLNVATGGGGVIVAVRTPADAEKVAAVFRQNGARSVEVKNFAERAFEQKPRGIFKYGRRAQTFAWTNEYDPSTNKVQLRDGKWYGLLAADDNRVKLSDGRIVSADEVTDSQISGSKR